MEDYCRYIQVNYLVKSDIKREDMMRYQNLKQIGFRKTRIAVAVSLSLVFLSCASMNPNKVDVSIKPEAPVKKATSFDNSLRNLGRMTKIYGTDVLNIMCRDISDTTGTAIATGGEIPVEITEMVKTTLNAIGGHVTYIPYNPENLIILREAQFSNFENKKIPNVVITGGITEFDRGLELRGKSLDFGVDTKPFENAPDWSPGDIVGVDYGKEKLHSVSRITIDFNMLDFQANAGIAQMQTVNTIQVQKAVAETELAFTLFGPTFGIKGNVKKIQGRHAAVRLLVQLSMMQLIGKFFDLPYWRMLPEGEPDSVVVDIVTADFYNMDELTKAVKTQELLFLHGYDVPISKTFNEQTQAALHEHDNNYQPGNDIDKDIFLKMYLSVPLTDEALERRYTFNKRLKEFLISLNEEKKAKAAEKKMAQKAETKKKPMPKVSSVKRKKSQKTASKKPQMKPCEDDMFNHIVILFENKDKVRLYKHFESNAAYYNK